MGSGTEVEQPRRQDVPVGGTVAAPDPAAGARSEVLTPPGGRYGQVGDPAVTATQQGPLRQDLAGALPQGDQRQPQPYTARELAWRPDPNSNSPSAQQWRAEHQQLQGQRLEIDQNGYYTVRHGDDLSTIAMRSLRDQGKPVGREAIQGEMRRIVDLNFEAFPGMERNPHFLRDGMRLRLTDYNGHGQTQMVIPPIERQQPVPRPEAGPRTDRPDIPRREQPVEGPGGRYSRYGEPGAAAGYPRREIPVGGEIPPGGYRRDIPVGRPYAMEGPPRELPIGRAGYERVYADPRYGGDPRYGADPRYVYTDPRYGADPRYGYGEPRYGYPPPRVVYQEDPYRYGHRPHYPRPWESGAYPPPIVRSSYPYEYDRGGYNNGNGLERVLGTALGVAAGVALTRSIGGAGIGGFPYGGYQNYGWGQQAYRPQRYYGPRPYWY